ncbi:MAG: hypothetical protein APR63_08770 [Desulfuromonas sp. SDB]|nr:MAG: hypothetical protein APR63_08770 [Desulfuromonas sp. SDB]
MINLIKSRYRCLNKISYQKGNVLYWMSREQRVENNWSLVTAQYFADQYKSDLTVIFCLQEDFLGAPWRHYHFMLEGLKQVSEKFSRLNIKFDLVVGYPPEILIAEISRRNIGLIVTDFDPLPVKKKMERRSVELHQNTFN